MSNQEFTNSTIKSFDYSGVEQLMTSLKVPITTRLKNKSRTSGYKNINPSGGGVKKSKIITKHHKALL